jgi:hypothetical protein
MPASPRAQHVSEIFPADAQRAGKLTPYQRPPHDRLRAIREVRHMGQDRAAALLHRIGKRLERCGRFGVQE